MKHIAALITAGVLIGAALIASALADGDKKGSGGGTAQNDGMPLLTIERFKGYCDGAVSSEGEITYNYDSHGRCISVVSAEGSVLISYGNNTVTKTSGEEESVYGYDENGNLLSVRVFSAGVLKSESLYTYGEDGRKLSCSYNFAHEPVNSGRTDYSYDTEGLLIKEVTVNGRGKVTRISEYSYNSEGVLLVTTVRDESGKVICAYSCEYDAEGRLVSELQRDEKGTVTVTTSYEYTAEGRLAVKAVVSAHGSEISREEHTYDACGNETGLRYYTMGRLCSERSYEYTTLGTFNLGR